MRSLYIRFPEAGKVEVCEEEVAAPGKGEVLCRARKSLISTGTETYCLRGVFDPGTNWAGWVRYPFRPGYSMVAEVIALGPDVTGLREGQRVLVSAPHQQYFKAAAERAHPIPDGLSDEEATWGTLANTTQIAVRRAGLALGETVGVVGLGLLGQLVCQYLLVSGARQVVAVDTSGFRVEAARAHGAAALQADVRDVREAVAERTGGRLLDAVWDATGNPIVLAPAVRLLRRRGRLILVGDTPTPTQQHLGPGLLSDSLAILAVHGDSTPPSYTEFTPWTAWEQRALFFDYLLQGRMRVADLVTHRHAPTEAPAVYEGLVRDRSAAIGVLFDWGRV